MHACLSYPDDNDLSTPTWHALLASSLGLKNFQFLEIPYCVTMVSEFKWRIINNLTCQMIKKLSFWLVYSCQKRTKTTNDLFMATSVLEQCRRILLLCLRNHRTTQRGFNLYYKIEISSSNKLFRIFIPDPSIIFLVHPCLDTNAPYLTYKARYSSITFISNTLKFSAAGNVRSWRGT